jgi:hypothetical protein
MVSDAERTAVQEMCRTYLIAISELSSGREWKDESNLKDAASTIVISYYKEVRPKLNYTSGNAATKQDFAQTKTSDTVVTQKGYKDGVWHTCDCGADVLTGTNKKTNEPFRYCGVCKKYLNKDGTTFKFPEKKGY